MKPAQYWQNRRLAYRWNTVAASLFTLQSVVMLVVITRVMDIVEAGVFTIAFAVANLFMNMGLYGMRKFQASDRKHEFTFQEYRASRAVTSAAMIVAGGVYVAYTALTLNYTSEKTLVLVVMLFFKLIDVVEDVYSGAYQLEDYLALGQFMISVRQVVTLVLFAAFALITCDLLVSLTATTVLAFAFFALQVVFVRRTYNLPTEGSSFAWGRVWSLLRECFPLFVALFLLFYIGSAPKYVIDATAGDTIQAYYGYISMPVFAVNILATFIYNPMITELTDMWQAGHMRAFLGRFGRIGIYIAGLTAVCVVGAWAVGVPVLNVLYNTDVGLYLVELLVLVAGGGFLALATLATVGITVIRFQKVLVPLYVAMAVAAFAVANVFVGAWGITGAAWAYFATMGITAVVFSVAFVYGAKKLSQ